ncbi:MAG: 16S rRNA (cytosine(967)-C(5))-methyltransferase RsmB, partial [Verrucomicrobiia bacterium]
TNTEVLRHDWLREPPPVGGFVFDAILLDAPCSNTGVLRRRADARWSLKPTSISTMAAIQDQLLEAVAPFLKPGGCLVYSTCSLEPEENEECVERFLATHSGWLLEKATFSNPVRDGVDGAFAARLRRGV